MFLLLTVHSDKELEIAFLLTFRCFSTPKKLLSSLISRYISTKDVDTEQNQKSTTIKLRETRSYTVWSQESIKMESLDEIRALIRIRVLQVIIKRYYFFKVLKVITCWKRDYSIDFDKKLSSKLDRYAFQIFWKCLNLE